MSENVPASKSKDVSADRENSRFKCKHCDMSFESEKGLKIHIGKTHQAAVFPPTPEKESCSSPLEELSITISPMERAKQESVANTTCEEPLKPPLLEEARAQNTECFKIISQYKEMFKFLEKEFEDCY